MRPALTSGTDVRVRADGLGWVTRALFCGADTTVTVSRRAVAGSRAWAIVPSVARARFLIPLGNRQVAAASMLAFNGLRSGPTRAVRAVLGTLVRAGAAQGLPFPVLTVTGPETDCPVRRLAAVLGEPGLVAAIGVRPPDPNRKPTLQLFGIDGTPRGYAKIGWNDATRALVRAESAALHAVPEDPSMPLVPRPLHLGEWGDRTVAVTAPLPLRVRRLPDPDRPRPDSILAVARRGGGPGRRAALRDSSYLDRLRWSAAAVPGGDGATLRAAVRRLDTADDPIEYGDWHGDWVPWNLGVIGEGPGRLVAWDWEHHGTDVPVGFDLAHQVFNTALVAGRRPTAEAAARAEEALHTYGPVLGIPPGAVPVILHCYLAELWLRTLRMASGGAGWNTDLHPSLLEVLARK